MSPSPTTSPRPTLQQDPALCLSHQNRIRSLYGSSSTNDSPTADMAPALSSPSVDDSDSARSGDGPAVQRTQSVLRSNSSDSVTMKSVKFAEDLVTEQLFDPAGPRSDVDSDSESVTEGRTASQLRQHFERLSVTGGQQQQQFPVSGKRRDFGRDSRGGGGGVIDRDDDGGDSQGGDGERLDPEDIALKVLADVATQRAEVELMQRQSAALSRDSSQRLRQRNAAVCGSSQDNSPVPVSCVSRDNSFRHRHNASAPVDNALHRHHHHHQNSAALHVDGTRHLRHEPPLPRRQPPPPSLALPPSGGMSPDSRALHRTASSPESRTVAQRPHVPPPPPPYTAPPSYTRHSPSPTGQGLVRGGSGGRGSLMGRGGLQSGENSISSDNSEGADSNLQSSVSSGYHSENGQGAGPLTKPADRGLLTQDFVNHSSAGAFAKPLSPASPSSPPPLSSFRPARPPSPLVRSCALQQSRPESTNSLSSQYSTSSSSTRSVVYRPLAAADPRGKAGPPRTAAPPPAVSPRPRVSPILRTPTASPNSSQGQGQGHKKVSFSDSEATESCNTSFEDGGGGGAGAGERGEEGRSELETTPARYSLSDMDAAYDSDSLTRYGKAGVARQLERLNKPSSPAAVASDSAVGRVSPYTSGVAYNDSPSGADSFVPSVNEKVRRVVHSSSPRVGHVEACRSLATPPAVPPRHPLHGKDSIPLQPRGDAACPYPSKGQLYGLGSQTSSSESTRGFSVCDPAVNSERAEGHGGSRNVQDLRGPDGSLTTGSREERLHSYGQPVRLNSKPVPLFLDKDRRTIAKSAVLQSSKC